MKRYGLPPTDEQLFEAVELRMGGFKWEIVAERLHRAVETVRKWPLYYAERWQHAIERGEIRHAVDSEAESVVVLRSLARGSPDDKVRYRSAKAIIDMRLGLGKLSQHARGHSLPSPDKSQLITELLERYSDDQLEQLDREGAEIRRQRDGSPPDSTPASAV